MELCDGKQPLLLALMENCGSQREKILFIAVVMRLRSVGRAVGQLTVAYEALVQADVFGLRASACIRGGKQLAHNVSGACVRLKCEHELDLKY